LWILEDKASSEDTTNAKDAGKLLLRDNVLSAIHCILFLELEQ